MKVYAKRVSMDEFNGLRNEIVSQEEGKNNLWIHMYVIFAALFVLGIEYSHYFWLATYIVIIPFQAAINSKRWNISKISAYIRIFYEHNNDCLNWESMHRYQEYNAYYEKIEYSVGGIIQRTGSMQLAFLATGFFIGVSINNAYFQNTMNLGLLELLSIIVSILLFVCVVFLNKEYHRFSYEELEYVIQKYKRSLSTTCDKIK